MFKFVILFCAVFAIAHGNTTQVSRCLNNNSGPLPINAHIVGCSRPPCALPQLQDAVIHVDFRTSRQVRSMRTLATAYLGVIPVPYDLGRNAVTCNFLTNASCPVQGGQLLKYTLRMPIEPFFPVGTQVTVEFRIVAEDNNESLMCLRVPIAITSPRVA